MMHMNWPSSSTASMSQLAWEVVVSPGAGAIRVGRAIGSSLGWGRPGEERAGSPARRAGDLGGDSSLGSGFRDPAFEEAAVGDGAGQRERLAVGGPGFGGAAETAEEFGPGRVPVLVSGQVQAVHDGQGGDRVAGFGDRHGPVQPDHVRTGPVGELAVERGDLRPVEGRFRLEGGDRGLQGVRTACGRPCSQGRVQQRVVQQVPGLGDLPPVPPRPVLVRQQHQVLAVEPGLAARVVQEHEREQAEHLRLGREQRGQHPAEPDRLAGQAWPAARSGLRVFGVFGFASP